MRSLKWQVGILSFSLMESLYLLVKAFLPLELKLLLNKVMGLRRKIFPSESLTMGNCVTPVSFACFLAHLSSLWEEHYHISEHIRHSVKSYLSLSNLTTHLACKLILKRPFYYCVKANCFMIVGNMIRLVNLEVWASYCLVFPLFTKYWHPHSKAQFGN